MWPRIWFSILACFTRLWRHWMPRFKKLQRRKRRQSSCSILRFSGWLSGFTTSLLSICMNDSCNGEQFPVLFQLLRCDFGIWLSNMNCTQDPINIYLALSVFLLEPMDACTHGLLLGSESKHQRPETHHNFCMSKNCIVHSLQANQFQLSLLVKHQEK